ncbi:MAG: histidine--tRNA ligase [Candidatus Dormibacteria bacterium]
MSIPAIAAPRGTRDYLEQDGGALLSCIDTHRQVSSLFGYRPVITPIFESTELFERGTGTGTDVVEKEMYTFMDRGDRSLALRPEGTPSVIRALVGDPAVRDIRPYRAQYDGPMFRYDRPQKGRYREFHQVGVEVLGVREPNIDVEVLHVAWETFSALGIMNVDIRLNSLGDREDRLRYRDELLAYYTPLRDELCEDCKRRLETNPLRLLDCKTDAKYVAAAPVLLDGLAHDTRTYFHDVQEGLRAEGIPFTVDPRIVRGLDYYCDTTFEFWHSSLNGAQNALGGGGRYDGLAEVLGLPSTPGVGYALGVERLMGIRSEEGNFHPRMSPTVLVLALDSGSSTYARSCAKELRAAAIPTALDLAQGKMDKRFRWCERMGIAWCIMCGEDELQDKQVTLRNLQDRTQERLGIADCIARLAALRED